MLPATLAWQMSVVSIGYAALTISGSATAIGLVSAATGISMLLFSLVGGVVADQAPGRTILLSSQSALAVGSLILLVLGLAGLVEVWHLATFAFVQGIAFSFNMPARQTYAAQVVGRRLLRSAVALNNAGVNFCRIAGPAIAGPLLAVAAVGVNGVFGLMTALYCLVLVALVRLPPVPPAVESAAEPKMGARDRLLEGLQYIRSSPILLVLLSLACVTLFFGMPYQQLMPVFSERVFEVGPIGLGIMMGANGLGALAGSLFVAALSGLARPALLQIACGTGFGLALVGFALAPTFAVAVFLMLLVGFASAAYIAFNSTLIMSNTEPRLYGRVLSVYLLTFAVTPVAALPLSWLTEQLGARTAVASFGAVVVLVVLGAALLYPPYRRVT